MNLELHSARLTLVPFAESDVDLCLEMFTDPRVRRFAGGPMASAEVRREMSNWVRRGAEGYIGIWCIRDRGTLEKYGSVALLPMPIEEDNTDFSLVAPGKLPKGLYEIGYFLKHSAWGRGYATEASKTLLDFVFRESPLTEVVATINPKNTPSRNVLLKSGFVDCGTMRSYGEDGPIYRINRTDWLAQPREDS